MRKSSYMTPLMSLMISALLIFLLFRVVDLSDLVLLFRRLDFKWLSVYLFLALAGLLVRAQRYLLLLGRDLKLAHLFWVTAVRNLFVDLLPARSGALSYIYILKKRYDIPVVAGTSTMFLAMFFDYIVFVPMLMFALSLSAVDIGLPSSPVMVLSSALLLMVVVLVLILDRFLRWLIFILSGFKGRPGKRGERWLDKVIRGIEGLSLDLERIKATKGIYGKLLLLTLFIRTAKYTALYFLLAAFLSGSGYSINALIFTHVLLGVAAAEMSSTLPVYSPAGLGTWDAAWTLAFVAMGYDVKIAAASGLSMHLLSKVLEYLLGTAGILFLFGRRF